jgi:Bardet-Biedl syndrome 9 protein
LNRNCASVTSLFEDVIESLNARGSLGANKKQLTFNYHNKVPVSIIISKDDQKIRLQSPDFASLWFILKVMTARLNELYGGSDGFEITYPDAIPLPQLFQYIDEHHHYRQEIAKLRKSLEDRTYQFRTIQKRLLNRFKDKNPSPLNNLDFLLNHTYVQILECGT